ncbi:transmembrane sensor [Mucilaginibacter sp. UYNi724]
MKENKEIQRLFKLYLEGKTNARQEEILFRYLADNRNKNTEFHEKIQEVWLNEPALKDHSEEAKDGLKQVWSKLEQKEQHKINRYQILKYAASVVLVLSAAFGWYSHQKHQPLNKQPIELLSKITGKGEKLKMILPDSSVVYLAGESRLTWPSRFVKGGHRNICLEGEAFFEVKRDTSSPFIISTGKIQTQVLGTSFNIYAYPKDRTFSVAVRTGKVKVSERIGNKISTLSMLTPGMNLVYHIENGKHVVNLERKDEINSWIENHFVFRNENMLRMLKRLERYYNVRFELKGNEMTDCRFNATFSNKNIKDVMEQLKVMSGGNMQYVISKDSKLIIIRGKGCQ